MQSNLHIYIILVETHNNPVIIMIAVVTYGAFPVCQALCRKLYVHYKPFPSPSLTRQIMLLSPVYNRLREMKSYANKWPCQD